MMNVNDMHGNEIKEGQLIKRFPLINDDSGEFKLRTVRAIGPMHEGGENMVWFNEGGGAHHPRATVVMSYKIFRVETGETEWWMAENEEQVKKGMELLYGAEEFDEITIEELSEKQIDALKFRDTEQEGEPDISARQMAGEYLRGAVIKGKGALPFLLASTCF